MGTAEDRSTADEAGTPATAATHEAAGPPKAAMSRCTFVRGGDLGLLAEPFSAETRQAKIVWPPIPSRRV